MSTTPHAEAQPMVTAVPHGNRPSQQPLRHLDPDIAQSIAEAKVLSGMSWRRLAAIANVSHPHLVLLSKGRRTPSLATAERIMAVLPMSAAEQAALRDAAVTDRGKSRPGR